jgi:2-polyprenyl-6-methoxyphenol hydroxylase-like FAD-dependent oxidoreductase
VTRTPFDVVVVGGGPVGLFLAARLAQLGIEVTVLERKTEARADSRSIGIHPPSLELLAELGVTSKVVGEGIAVRRGLAFSERRILGEVRFDELPGDFRYVLSLPQPRTEAILRQRLHELAPGALIEGATVFAIRPTSEGVLLAYAHDGEEKLLRARTVIGCDGARSTIRAHAGIPFAGGRYGAHFVMGDFRDETAFGASAAIFLTEGGLVESFPLPRRTRRWVIATDAPVVAPRADHLASAIFARTSLGVDPRGCSMVSAFTPERRLADHFVRGPIVLAGDAAHVVSPIGGQGLNLGWLDAAALAEALFQGGVRTTGISNPLRSYESERRKRAAIAIRRAELNMWIGRSRDPGDLRRFALSLALSSRAAPALSRMFTMRGL